MDYGAFRIRKIWDAHFLWFCVNALNGPAAFLQMFYNYCPYLYYVCQCPKRAYNISTVVGIFEGIFEELCQCPKQAYIISTDLLWLATAFVMLCQCPKRAYIISTCIGFLFVKEKKYVSMS